LLHRRGLSRLDKEIVLADFGSHGSSGFGGNILLSCAQALKVKASSAPTKNRGGV
jgi:hypothetical protein